jgi:hypothetical protein
MKLLIMLSSPASHHFLPLRPKYSPILLTTLFSEIKDPRGTVCEGVDWIHQAQWWTHLNAVVNFWVPYNT